MKRQGLLLAAAMMIPAAAGAQTQAPAIAGTRLDIVAEGSVTRVPDIVTISAGVVSQAQTAAAAMGDNASRMSATVAALKKAGVADRDIATSALSLNPQYRYADNQPPTLVGYQATNQVTVKFRDIKRAGAILDALVAEGANQINGPAFSVDHPEAALDEARIQAIATARRRADIYARAAGLSVKRIIAISEGEAAPPPRPMPMMSAARMDKAETQIQAGEQALVVTVSVSFELQ